MPFQVGERVGDYEVVDILGFGGMGQVYKVRNIISKRVEAMKVLLPNLEGDRQLAERFIAEIQVQAQLEHPNIAALHTAQRVENQLLMIMEFVEGSSLDALLKNGPLPVARAMDYTRQVLGALAYAHEHGIVHRDIKPANMMLTPGGTIKLMDFGIAKMADRRLTQTGSTLGSLFYMSPEQINDPFNIDGRADIYSVGVSLYEMVTGRRPFAGDSDYQIMCAHLAAAPIPPIQVDPQLPPALNDVILMSIAKERERRFQSAEAFRRALEGVQASLGVAPAVTPGPATVTPPNPQPGPSVVPPPLPPPTVPPAAKGASSRRGLYLAMGSVATIAVLAVALWQAPRLFHSTAASPTVAQPEVTQQPVVPPPRDAQTPSPQPEQTAVTPAQAPTPAPENVQLQRPAASQPLPVNRTQAQQPQRSVPRSQSSSPIETQAAPEPPQPAPQPVEQARPGAPAVDAGALREARESLMMLGTRARAANTTLQTLKSQQAAMGVNLRSDIVTSQQRMEFHLDEAEAALKSGDAEGARKNLATAERELDRLEKFLGR